MDCSLPGSSVHGIFQARVLEWVAITFSRRSSQPRIPNLGLPHCRQMLYHLSHQGSPTVGMGGSNLHVGRTQGCVIVQLLGRSDSLRLHGLHHARLPCPSQSPGACSNSCLLSRWCHPEASRVPHVAWSTANSGWIWTEANPQNLPPLAFLAAQW